MIIQTAAFCLLTQQQPCAVLTAPACAHSPEYTQGAVYYVRCRPCLLARALSFYCTEVINGKIILHWFLILQPLTNVCPGSQRGLIISESTLLKKPRKCFE